MTTIDPDKSIQTTALFKKTHATGEDVRTAFDAVFKPMIESSETTGSAVMTTDFAESLSCVRPARFSAASESGQTAVMGKVRDVLDTLDVYQQKLEEETVSLKEIDPILETLITRHTSLQQLADVLPQGDERLRSIVNESLSLSSLEIARFRSGVYNSGG